MKHLKLLLIVLLLPLNYGYSQCTELFISEYIEGSSNNKYIEVYNPTNTDIVLTGNYTIEVYSNGSSTVSSTVNLTGTILANNVFVIGNTSATLVATVDQTSGSINFNGNDAVLLKNGTTIIDSFGQIGIDPGTNWPGTCGTTNQTLVRNSTVLTGDTNSTDAFNTDSEWTCFPQNTVTDLGSHTSDCFATNEIQLQQPLGSNVACGYMYDYGIQSIGTNTNLVVTLLNTGSVDLTISNLSFTTGSNFSLISPPTLPLVIAGSGSQDITIQFNPNALGVFNDILTIDNDDSNEGTCTIMLEGEGSSSCSTTTTIIAAQDFEMAVSDTWVYTPNHAAIINFWYETTSLSSIASAQSGTTFWGATDLERSGHTGFTHELPFDNTNISAFNNVELSFYYYTESVDSSDSFEYELFYDSVSQGIVDISANTANWTQVQVNIPDTVSNVQIIFYADLDAANDQAGIDNLVISSTSLDEAVWNGASWSNGTGPTSSIPARISGNYNTNVTNPGFTACSLIVDTGFTLTVDENYTIEIENNVTNNGNISLLTDGSFVQNNDSSTFINTANNDDSTVTKNTAPINAWYEYTYWSSPVQGETIGDTFFGTNADRRYLFNGANYRDSFAETANNNNTTTPGQDDVDDDFNDWQLTPAANIMQPGVGYACTLSVISFGAGGGAGNQFAHIFSGPFNNGVFTTPIYRNDAETLDTNWNFIGNPYPSAISTNAFFNENAYDATTNPSGAIDGAIYLWSQNTAPLDTTNGNSALNFDTSDYAIINFVGTTGVGGDGNTPTLHVPSGQGFFVSYNNNGGSISNATVGGDIIYTGEVVFNNSMRVSGNNNQFFKNNNQNQTLDNKLWLNLTSDNGIYSQILIGYVPNASDGDDGMSYDAVKNTSTGYASFMYSTLPNSNKKYGIQGKATSSLDINEEIPIGIYTSINVPTLYTISISKFEGAFLNSNTVYLEDALMNTVHDLSNSNYTFTSAVGEFNDRFKIVYNTNTLSTSNFDNISHNLSIVELEDDNVKFALTSKDLTIKNVEILDMLGRSVYQFRGSEKTEVYNLSNLSSSVYIAKIELSNGSVISKKAIKK